MIGNSYYLCNNKNFTINELIAVAVFLNPRKLNNGKSATMQAYWSSHE